MDEKNFKKRIRTIKYGGIKYINNVPTEKINEFVNNLPEEDRESMAEVTQILEEEGLISLLPPDEENPS